MLTNCVVDTRLLFPTKSHYGLQAAACLRLEVGNNLLCELHRCGAVSLLPVISHLHMVIGFLQGLKTK